MDTRFGTVEAGFSVPATKEIDIPEPGKITVPQPIRKPVEAPKVPERTPARRELAPVLPGRAA